MPTHFQCLSGSNFAIRKAVVNPFESRNVPWLSEHNGPGGDFTTDRMCFAQLGHFSTLARWSQVNANGARTVKTLSTILFMGGNRSEDFDLFHSRSADHALAANRLTRTFFLDPITPGYSLPRWQWKKSPLQNKPDFLPGGSPVTGPTDRGSPACTKPSCKKLPQPARVGSIQKEPEGDLFHGSRQLDFSPDDTDK